MFAETRSRGLYAACFGFATRFAQGDNSTFKAGASGITERRGRKHEDHPQDKFARYPHCDSRGRASAARPATAASAGSENSRRANPDVRIEAGRGV
jgi:hypothetical protein